MKSLYLNLRSDTVENSVDNKTLVWAIGGIEQHGPHLPLGVDTDISCSIATEVADRINGVLLPTLPFSARSLPQSGGGMSFPGTIFVDGTTLTAFIKSVLQSTLELPASRIIIINGHYENEAFIFEAIDSLRHEFDKTNKECAAFSWWNLVSEDWISTNLPDFPGWHAEHAGLTETSLMLYLKPELVGADRPDHALPPLPGLYRIPLARYSTSTKGVLSLTSMSTAKIGKELFEHVVERICHHSLNELVDKGDLL